MQTLSYIEQKTKNADIARYILSFISPLFPAKTDSKLYYMSCAYAGLYECATSPDAILHGEAKYIIYGAMRGGNPMIARRILSVASSDDGAAALVIAVGGGDVKYVRMILSHARRDPAYFCSHNGLPPRPHRSNYRCLLMMSIQQLGHGLIEPRHIRVAELIAAEWRRGGYPPVFTATIEHAAIRAVFRGIAVCG